MRAFSALIEHAGDFIGIADLDGRLRYVNPAGLQMMGANGVEELGQVALGAASGDEWRAETQVRNLASGEIMDVELNAFLIHDPESGEPESIGVIQRDISERNRAWRQLERSNEERRRLLAGIVSAQELERERIASDVHDDSIQVMTGAAIRLQMLAQEIEDAGQRDQLDKLDQSVRASIVSLRHLIFELRPPALDAHGVGPAIDSYLSHTLASEKIDYRLRDDISDEPPSGVRTVMYRVTQEAISNARRHGSPSRIEVSLWSGDGGWNVRVEDDGTGFDAAGAIDRPGHLGLIGMRERVETTGGRIAIASEPGSGTVVEFWVPDEHWHHAGTP